MKGERPAVWLVASREPATNHRSIRLPRRAELPPLLSARHLPRSIWRAASSPDASCSACLGLGPGLGLVLVLVLGLGLG